MKTLSLFLIALTITGFRFPIEEDCKAKANRECVPKIPAGFNYLKAFDLEWKEKEYIEYSYVFTQRSNYSLLICKNTPTSPKIDVFNSNRTVVAANSIKDEIFDKMKFGCSATGIYYIRIYKGAGEASCGVCLLSFSR
jgi:hypothetical protein